MIAEEKKDYIIYQIESLRLVFALIFKQNALSDNCFETIVTIQKGLSVCGESIYSLKNTTFKDVISKAHDNQILFSLVYLLDLYLQYVDDADLDLLRKNILDYIHDKMKIYLFWEYNKNCL